MPKKLTTEDFIAKAREKHGDKYKYDKVEYKGTNIKVIINCFVHGDFKQTPNGHLNNNGCKQCGITIYADRRTKTKESFILDAIKVHGSTYTYNKTNYIYSTHKVVITCKKHGDFNQSPNGHLSGKGCKKCSIELYKYNTSEFVELANKKHNNIYNYEKVVYEIGLDKIEIVCRAHGSFLQRADLHLRGSGCTKCADEDRAGYSRTRWIKRANSKVCTFYTIRCFNEKETFYKIGITMDSVRNRYKGGKIPYTYEIVSEIYGEASFIWDLELQEKRKLKEFNYQPKTKFGGSKTECFTQYKLNK